MKLNLSWGGRSLLAVLLVAMLGMQCVEGSFAIGGLKTLSCNIQTTLDFQFSSSSTTINNKFLFLDRFGNDLSLSLSGYSYSAAAGAFATGYTTTPTGGMAFQYPSPVTNGNIFVIVPVTTAACGTNADCIDLTSSKAPSNTLQSYSGTVLSPFNFFQLTDYNQWYTAVDSGSTSTVLANKFVYKVASFSAVSDAAVQTAFNALTWNAGAGDMLCYASLTTGNTHLRENVALWFIWWFIILYWLAYLLSDATNRAIFNKERHRDNKWTCWSVYSITHLAHEEFFTRLSRLTVILAQTSIQAVFVASIMAAQYVTGPAVIIWAAAISWVATIIFPFLWGNIFHRRIYEKHLMKYEHRRTIMAAIDKSAVKNLEDEIDVFEEKLYGYNHWYNSIVFIIFFVCWPIAISRLQALPRTAHVYNWYWLAAMSVIFVWEYFIFEPILVAIFHNSNAVKNRGGYYYDFKIGEAYLAVTDN